MSQNKAYRLPSHLCPQHPSSTTTTTLALIPTTVMSNLTYKPYRQLYTPFPRLTGTALRMQCHGLGIRDVFAVSYWPGREKMTYRAVDANTNADINTNTDTSMGTSTRAVPRRVLKSAKDRDSCANSNAVECVPAVLVPERRGLASSPGRGYSAISDSVSSKRCSGLYDYANFAEFRYLAEKIETGDYKSAS